MSVGTRIRDKRIENGWSQEYLAQKMGYKTRNAIYQYEKADNMKLSLIEKFAEALGCTTSYLMGWDETPEDQIKKAYVEQQKNAKLLEIAKEHELLLLYYAQLTPEQQDQILKTIKSM